MRALGFLVLLFGIALIVLHAMNQQVSFLDWTNNWGEDGRWMISGGAVVLGLLMVVMGRKKGGDGK